MPDEELNDTTGQETEEEVLPGDLALTMDEMSGMAMLELMKKAGVEPFLRAETNSPAPQIPEKYRNAFENL